MIYDFKKHPERILTSVKTPEDKKKILIEVSALTVNVGIADMMLVCLMEKYAIRLAEDAIEEGLYKRETKRDINATISAIKTSTAQLVSYERKSFPIAKYLNNHRNEYDADGVYTAMVQVEGEKIYRDSLIVLESVCKNSANRYVPKWRKTVANALLIHSIAVSGKEVYESYKTRCEKLLDSRISLDMSVLRHYHTVMAATSAILERLRTSEWETFIDYLQKDARQALRAFQSTLSDIWMSDMALRLYEQHERDYVKWYCAMAIIDCYQQGCVPSRTKREVQAHIGASGMAQFCAEAKRLGEKATIIDDPLDLWESVEPLKHKYMDILINFYTKRMIPADK